MKNKNIKEAVILAFMLYTIHMSSFLIWDYFSANSSSYYYSGLGAFVYGLVFALWGYVLISGIYIYISKNDENRLIRYFKGIIMAVFGYFLSRIPDFIDNHFFNNFSWRPVILFLLLIPVLVELEFWLRRKMDKSA